MQQVSHLIITLVFSKTVGRGSWPGGGGVNLGDPQAVKRGVWLEAKVPSCGVDKARVHPSQAAGILPSGLPFRM